MTIHAGGDGEDRKRQIGMAVMAMNEALASRYAQEEAEFIAGEAAIMASSPMDLSCGDLCGVALTGGTGRSMMEIQKFRRNFYGETPRNLFRFARLQAERNWFVRPVVEDTLAIFNHGFDVQGAEAKKWLRDTRTNLPKLPLARIAREAMYEYLVNTNVVAMWRRASREGAVPYVMILDTSTVEYEMVAGARMIKVDYSTSRRRKLPENMKTVLGERAFKAIVGGKRLEISEGDQEWDFEVLTGGVESSFAVPAVTVIQDDLEFVEAVKVGDWNGAYRRRITLLHATKGYGVQSGTNAGSVRTHAKRGQLQSINEWMKKLNGHHNMATNFDQDFKNITFPAEFFKDDIVAPSLARLLLFGGIPAVALLKSESQINGVSPYLMLILRARAFEFRRRFQWFLHRIFNAESFIGRMGDAPPLVPEWSDRLLYTIKEMQERTQTLRTSGASRRTLREEAGLNHAEESRRNRDEIQDPDAVVPVFEDNQGLSQARYPGIYPVAAGQSSGSQGDPGRPSAQA
jgi:hypothetical protein